MYIYRQRLVLAGESEQIHIHCLVGEKLFQIGGLIAALGGGAVMFVSPQLQTER